MLTFGVWPGQDGASVDKRHADSAMGQDSTRPVCECGSRSRCYARQVSGRRMARIVESRWKRARRQLRRREGYPLEGEPERRLGMCE